MVESAERYRRDDEGDDDDEEEEVDETGYKAVKDAVLFAIDISQSMLEPISSGKDGTESAASAALKCAYSLMQQRIISNPRDMMGILLFGTEASKFQDEAEENSKLAQYPHCYLLADLDIPAAADVKRLRSLVQDEDASRSLLKASTEDVTMSNVLFCANQIFTTKAPNFSSRRLFLVTDNDQPHADKKDLRASAVVRARDLYDLGVIIELFPISRQGHEFDRSVFYDDVVYQTNPSDPEAPAPLVQAARPASGEDGLALLNSLLSSINSKSVPKRAMFSNLPLELSPTLRISVKGYIIYKKQVPQRTCFVWTEGEKPQIAVGTTTRLADETARTVDKGEIRKAYKFGGEAITFTPDEVTELRSFGDPVIRILGFKPMSLLPPWAVIKPATFVYPSEEEFVGSTRLFSALQQILFEKQKFALVWYIARKNATPVIAALVAGNESRGDFGEQDMPAGLWLCPLPFADDIRQNPRVARHVVAPDPLVDRMRDIMTQLLLPKATYDPAKYPNPSLQWHYRILQAIALEEDLPEQAEDKTIPRYRQIDKRAGEFAKAWGQELDKQYQKWQRDNGAQGTGVGSKRPAADTERSVPEAKKSRATPDPSSLSITDDDMRSKFKKQRIATLGVNDLKAWIKSKSLGSVTGLKKADLVDMIEAYFENKMEVD